MNPSLRGAPKYRRFLITTGSAVIPGLRRRTTSPALPPSRRASARSLVAFQEMAASFPTVNDFHVTGYTLGTIVVIASRCSLVTDGSNVISAHSEPLEKSEPR